MNDMYYITGDRKKRKYGYFGNFAYYLKIMWEWDRGMFFCAVFAFVPAVAASYLGTLLPASLVAGLEQHGSLLEAMLPMLLIALAGMLCNMANSAVTAYYEVQEGYLTAHYTRKYAAKVMDIDYERLEDKDFKPVFENTWASAQSGRGIGMASNDIPRILISVASILLYGAILARQSVILLFLVMLSVGLNLFLLFVARRMHQKYFGKISKYGKGDAYITTQCMDSAAGKDIRIYQMLDFILKKYDENLAQIDALYGKIHNWYCFRNVSSVVLCFAREAFASCFLAAKLSDGQITAAEFVYYVGVIAGFTVQFEVFVRCVMNLNAVNTSIGYFREFMETKSIWRRDSLLGPEKMKEFQKNPVKVELRNVTYTYQGNAEPTVRNISLTIRPGEKLALIGLNGAGKTTLVKLICGLYRPDSGEILLNDIPVEQFTRKEYFGLISVLFQDASLLPLSVDDNITSGGEKDAGRLARVLELSGFADKYESLAGKGDTKLIKKVEETAVDFSGGEKQKLLFARALYQDTPLIILDEPTAALDPIAEYELYQNFGEAMEGRTAVYISHRLSSTRFCDRIILLEHGEPVEEGTHETLLAKGGRYARLFEMQSRYYQEEERQKKRSALMGDDYRELGKEGIFHE